MICKSLLLSFVIICTHFVYKTCSKEVWQKTTDEFKDHVNEACVRSGDDTDECLTASDGDDSSAGQFRQNEPWHGVWPDGIVPYRYNKSLSPQQRLRIRGAMLEFHNKTCVRFVQLRQFEKPKQFVHLYNSTYNHAFLGRRGGTTGVGVTIDAGHHNDSKYWHSVVVHELMHAIGFYHEQNRPDRDNYITVKWENAQNGTENNVLRLEKDYAPAALKVPYDINSVMHYNAKAGSKSGKPTMVAKVNESLLVGRTNVGLTELDVQKIRVLYNCKSFAVLNLV